MLPESEPMPFIAHLDIPPTGQVPLEDLRDLVDLMDNLPGSTLITVQSDMIRFEVSS